MKFRNMYNRMQTTNYDWQCDTNTLAERNLKMLENDLWTDCSFLLEDYKINAHRIILAQSSAVFQAMFFGPLADKNLVIPIPNATAASFQTFLKLIYSNGYPKDNIEDIETMCGTYMLAKQYLIANKLIEQLQSLICVTLFNDLEKNIPVVFDCTLKICDDELKGFIVQTMCIKIKKINFDQMFLAEELLLEVVKSKNINIAEHELLIKVIEWGVRKLNEEDIEISASTLKQKLSNITEHIHFSGPMISKTLNLLPSSLEVLKNYISDFSKENDCISKIEFIRERVKFIQRYPVSYHEFSKFLNIDIKEAEKYMKDVDLIFDKVRVDISGRPNDKEFLCSFSSALPPPSTKIEAGVEYVDNFTLYIADKYGNKIYEEKNFNETVPYNHKIYKRIKLNLVNIQEHDYLYFFCFRNNSGIYPVRSLKVRAIPSLSTNQNHIYDDESESHHDLMDEDDEEYEALQLQLDDDFLDSGEDEFLETESDDEFNEMFNDMAEEDQ